MWAYIGVGLGQINFLCICFIMFGASVQVGYWGSIWLQGFRIKPFCRKPTKKPLDIRERFPTAAINPLHTGTPNKPLWWTFIIYCVLAQKLTAPTTLYYWQVVLEKDLLSDIRANAVITNGHFSRTLTIWKKRTSTSSSLTWCPKQPWS